MNTQLSTFYGGSSNTILYLLPDRFINCSHHDLGYFVDRPSPQRQRRITELPMPPVIDDADQEYENSPEHDALSDKKDQKVKKPRYEQHAP